MAKSSVFIDILHNIDALSETEQKALAGKLLAILSAPQSKENLLNGEDTSKYNDDAVVVCPYCGGTHIVKKGFSDNHITRRYLCRDCHKSFRRTTNTVLSYTHKSAEAWEQFILLTLKGASLKTCCRRYKIALGTAFAWRHKVLAAMAKDQTTRMMSGIIEMDETFVSISYKGNHKHSKSFTMPRKAFKRGSDNRSHHKACILCGTERGGQAYGEVVCSGSITAKLLENIIPEKIDPCSIVITDALSVYQKYFKTAPQAHEAVNSKVRKNGVYHINHINNFHARFKSYLDGYKGVSTKYLNNYVGLFVWLENYRQTARSEEEEATSAVLGFGNYMPVRKLATWEHEPALAPAA